MGQAHSSIIIKQKKFSDRESTVNTRSSQEGGVHVPGEEMVEWY